MPATFVNTPFDFAIRAFDELHPQHDVTIQWVPDVCEAVGVEKRADQFAGGVTRISLDGTSPPMIYISIELPMHAALETLVHELAHVAAGCTDNSHSPAWKAAEEALWVRYTELVYAAAEEGGAVVMSEQKEHET